MVHADGITKPRSISLHPLTVAAAYGTRHWHRQAPNQSLELPKTASAVCGTRYWYPFLALSQSQTNYVYVMYVVAHLNISNNLTDKRIFTIAVK